MTDLPIHPLLRKQWCATVDVERAGKAWVVRAEVRPKNPAVLEDAKVGIHQWWLAVGAGGVKRWGGSFKDASDELFAEDLPMVGELLIPPCEEIAVDVELWMRIGDAEDLGAPRGYRAHLARPAVGRHVIVLEPAPGVEPPTTAPEELIPPKEVFARDTEAQGVARAVLPGVGVLEDRLGTWVLWTPNGDIELPGFLPDEDARPLAFTSGPDGNLAVVWSMRLANHLALYRLPNPTPRVVIEPSPYASGNPAQPGVFYPDGHLLVAPVNEDELGVIDVTHGLIRHRLPAGYVGHAAWALDGDRVWVASPGHAKSYSLADGSLLDDVTGYSLYGGDVAFSIGPRRVVWVELIDDDGGPTAILWQDPVNGTGQVLIDDVVDHPPYAFEGGDIVVYGRRGLWHIDPVSRAVARLSDEISDASMFTGAVPVVEQSGERLIAWTTDPAAFEITLGIELGPRGE